jgi:hypothetical protein
MPEYQKVDFNKLITTWTPTPNVSHKIIFGGRRIKTITFFDKETTKTKNMLQIDIISVDGKPCDPPLTFSSGSYYYLQQMKPIIEAADNENRGVVGIVLKMDNARRYTILDTTPDKDD